MAFNAGPSNVPLANAQHCRASIDAHVAAELGDERGDLIRDYRR